MNESQKHSAAALAADNKKQAAMKESIAALRSGDMDTAYKARAEVEKQESIVNHHLSKIKGQ